MSKGKLLIKNAKVYSDEEFIKKDIFIKDGLFSPLEKSDISNTLDAEGMYLLPSFFDTHSHGAMGIDVNNASLDDFRTLSRFYASHGVGMWLCSILTDSKEVTLKAIKTAVEATREDLGGARLMGIHLEGPFLSPLYKGAMPSELLQKGSIALMDEYYDASNGTIKSMTVAPEVDGVVDAIKKYRDKIKFSLGHSNATYTETYKAIDSGASSFTHTGNAMRLFDRHEPGIFGAALSSNLYMEMICDGLHLSPETVDMYLKVKDNNRLVGISDSISATGLGDGEYMLGINHIRVINGDAKLMDGKTRAGSTLTLDNALKNVSLFSGKKIEEGVKLFSTNPIKLHSLDNSFGRIENGYNADFALYDEDFNVCSTFVGGVEVFKK